MIFSCVQNALEEHIMHFHNLGQQVPTPIELPTTELRLIVSSGQSQYAPYTSPSPNIGTPHADWNAYMFKTQKDQLLKELSQKARLDLLEISKFYDQFAQASASRSSDGRVDQRSFEGICRVMLGMKVASRELFNALDGEHSGTIDFKGFIEALGVVRNGTIEEKLLISFRAYDINGNGLLEKEDVAEMVRSLGDLKGGMPLSQFDVSAQVGILCEKFDFDRDGKLSFQEFRAAGMSAVLTLAPFYNSFAPVIPDYRSFGDSITCYRCSTKFIPAGGYTGSMAKLCPSCTISTPRTPSRYL